MCYMSCNACSYEQPVQNVGTKSSNTGLSTHFTVHMFDFFVIFQLNSIKDKITRNLKGTNYATKTTITVIGIFDKVTPEYFSFH